MPLLLDNEAISVLLEPTSLVHAIEAAYRAYARGSGVSAPRADLQADSDGTLTYQLGIAAGLTEKYGCVRIKSDITYLREVDGLTRKEKYAVRPGLYCGLVLLFAVKDGSPLAILHDGLLQQMRVAADSAIGARLMMRKDSRTLGLLGSGGMARAHLQAVAPATGMRRVVVYSPTSVHAERLAIEARELGFEAEALPSASAVAAEADILCACTNAVGPVIFGDDLRPGMHVMAIGGSLDAAASERIDRWLRLGLATAAPEWGGGVVEDECLSFSASGEKKASGGSRRFGSIPLERRILLADLLSDPACGRADSAEITFSDRGNIHGLQFAAAAGHVYERALASEAGRRLVLADLTQSIRN